MSESAVLYEAMREIIRVTVQLEVGKATQPLQEEVRSLRTQLETRSATPLAGVPGPAGKDGKDGVDGKDGRDGKDGERGPAGEKGERGADGLHGRDGAPGHDGKDGAPGERGLQGERGADGINGRDGAASMVPGPQGERGEHGADGIATRDEIEAIWDERHADLQVRNLADSWRGAWTADATYTRGNVAQWDGSPWLAVKDNRTKPGTSPDWVLFAKKGRDGRK